MRSILFVILFLPMLLFGQPPNFNWVRIMPATNTSGSSLGYSITIDSSGNLYATGGFNGTVDFDPGPGVFELTSEFGSSMFICKLDSSGNFIWAKKMQALNSSSAVFGAAISIDRFGNVYTTGFFDGIIDFDPGTSTSGLDASPYDHMCFICRLDTAGNFKWARKIGRGSDEGGGGNSISTDKNGNVYTSGVFGYEADFDPGPGTYLIDGGELNVFISKLDSSGNFVWAIVPQLPPGADGFVRGGVTTIDSAGNIYGTGAFAGTIDFDPGPGSYTLTSATPNGFFFTWDVYIWKLTAAGNLVWVKQTGGANGFANGLFGIEEGSTIAVDSRGDIYTGGYFTGTVDFDPGPGTYYLPGVTGFACYFTKLNADGSFAWARQLPYLASMEITLDRYSNNYITGKFYGPVDFDPGPATFTLTPVGASEMYALKLDAKGNFTWVLQMRGADNTSYSIGSRLVVDKLNNIYSTGSFQGTVDFDPGTNVYNQTSSALRTTFVHKMSQCMNASVITTDPLSQTVCAGGDVTFVVNASGAISYQWQVSSDGGIVYTNITGATGPSLSLQAVTAAQNGYYYRCKATGECDTAISSAAMLSTVNMITVQPSSITVCAGTSTSFNVTTTGNITSYQWQQSTDGGITFNDIADATASIYTISSPTASQNGYRYQCRVTGTCNTISSSAATLTVIAPVSITSQPVDKEVCVGNNTSFSVVAGSNQTIIYQWQISNDGGTNYHSVVNGNEYSGATTSILSITGAGTQLNNTRYRCLLSNNTCPALTISNAASLTVHKLPSVTLTVAPLTNLLPGQTTTLTSTTTGSPGGLISSTWLYNNVVVANTGNIRVVNIEKIGTYQVRVQETWSNNVVCSNQSAPIYIGVVSGKKLFMYPSPNDGQFTILCYNSSGAPEQQTVTIYDSRGAKVYQKKFDVSGYYTLLDINIAKAAGGVYEVVVTGSNEERLGIGKVMVY